MKTPGEISEFLVFLYPNLSPETHLDVARTFEKGEVITDSRGTGSFQR